MTFESLSILVALLVQVESHLQYHHRRHLVVVWHHHLSLSPPKSEVFPRERPNELIYSFTSMPISLADEHIIHTYVISHIYRLLYINNATRRILCKLCRNLESRKSWGKGGKKNKCAKEFKLRRYLKIKGMNFAIKHSDSRQEFKFIFSYLIER